MAHGYGKLLRGYIKTKLLRMTFIVLAILSVVLIYIVNYNKEEGQKEKIPSVPNDADVTIEQVHYVETDAGVKEWELKASKGMFFKDKDQAIFKAIAVALPRHQMPRPH